MKKVCKPNPQKKIQQQSLESNLIDRVIQKQPSQFIDVDGIQIEGQCNQNSYSIMQLNTGHCSEPYGIEQRIKKIEVITQNHSLNPDGNQINILRVSNASHQFEGPIQLNPQQNNLKFASKRPQKKLQTWKRQNFLKYYCFMKIHEEIFDRKQLWINKKCFEYMGFKNRQSYGVKHRYFKVYHKSIEAINHSIKNLYNFSHAEIERENQKIVEFIEKMRIQQKYLLQQPFQFQAYLESLNMNSIFHLCRINFGQTVIESSSLKYSIINLENAFDKSKQTIFQNSNQKIKKLSLLFEASFTLNETQLQRITDQIVSESDLIEQEKHFHPELLNEKTEEKKYLNLGELRKTIRDENDKYGAQKIKFKNKRKYKTCNSEKMKRSSYKCIQKQSIESKEQKNLSEFFDSKQELSKQERIQQSSKQWLSLSKMLDLKKQQIWRLQLQAESKVYELRVIRRSDNSIQVKQAQLKTQKLLTKTKTKTTKKTINQEENEDDKFSSQTWTEEQIVRLIAFMVLNQKLFVNIRKIQRKVMTLMVQFLKSRNYMQAKKKYDALIENCQNLEDVLQSAFLKYKFTREQLQTELKRQYQRYLNNPSSIILEGEKGIFIQVSPESTEIEIMALIEARITSNPIEIMCMNSDMLDDSLSEKIQKHINEFKQEYQITQNLKSPQINAIYQRMATNVEALPPIKKFRALVKHFQMGRKKYEKRNSQKTQRNKFKLLKFMRCFSQKSNFQLRIKVEFCIKKSPQSIGFVSTSS